MKKSRQEKAQLLIFAKHGKGSTSQCLSISRAPLSHFLRSLMKMGVSRLAETEYSSHPDQAEAWNNAAVRSHSENWGWHGQMTCYCFFQLNVSRVLVGGDWGREEASKMASQKRWLKHHIEDNDEDHCRYGNKMK
jgi:hypothetical protein